ncbi:hypothetical protein J31TS3_37630 [Paenibacillus lactis]|nr:hypothetical protein J31TS3_37630 [Paenibacillus lactis]
MSFRDDELDVNKGDLGPGRIAVPKDHHLVRGRRFFLCRNSDFFAMELVLGEPGG